MTDVLLHVGLHKTASTFLQRDVFPLIEDSVTYYINKSIEPVDRDKLVIISDETFTASMNRAVKSRQERVCNALCRQHPMAKVLIVFRDKKEFVQSLYSQYVKSGGIHDYGRWRKKIFDDDALDYDRIISMYKKRFKEVLVLDYRLLQINCYDFIMQICEFIHRPVPKYHNRIVNRRLKKWMLLPVRIINIFCATPMNAQRGVLPYCMHPKFWYLCLHWKAHRSDKKVLRGLMFYGAQKKEKIRQI